MSYATRRRLLTLANLLQHIADGAVTLIEVIISDHAGKRPRRSHRVITQRVYHKPRQTVQHVHYYQPLPYPRRVHL